MIVRTLSMAALLLLWALAAAEAASRPAPDAVSAAVAPRDAYMAHRGHHRHRWAHRHRRHHAYRGGRPWWLVTRPAWPSCYDRYPFYCTTPAYSRYVVRHRHHPRAVVSVRG